MLDAFPLLLKKGSNAVSVKIIPEFSTSLTHPVTPVVLPGTYLGELDDQETKDLYP